MFFSICKWTGILVMLFSFVMNFANSFMAATVQKRVTYFIGSIVDMMIAWLIYV